MLKRFVTWFRGWYEPNVIPWHFGVGYLALVPALLALPVVIFGCPSADEEDTGTVHEATPVECVFYTAKGDCQLLKFEVGDRTCIKWAYYHGDLECWPTDE